MLLNIQRYYVVVFCWSSVTTLAVSRKYVPAVQIILNTATFPFPASPVDTYTMVNIALRDAPAPSEFKSPIFTLKDNAHCLNISRKWSVTQIFGFTKDFLFIKKKTSSTWNRRTVRKPSKSRVSGDWIFDVYKWFRCFNTDLSFAILHPCGWCPDEREDRYSSVPPLTHPQGGLGRYTFRLLHTQFSRS